VCAWRFGKKVDGAFAARLAVLPDALGKEGTMEADFCPKHGFFHGYGLVVEPIDDGIDWGKDVQKPMKGIEGNVLVLLGDKTEREIPLEAEGFFRQHLGPEGKRVLPGLSLHFGRPGNYVLRINVTKVPPALVGVPHRVVARYQMCGLERLQARVMWAIAAAFLFVGGLVSLLLLSTSRAAHAPAQEADEDTQ
jgi:hypothetical protein